MPARKYLSIAGLMLLAFCLTGCEKIDMNDQIMQSFYDSSCQLTENTDPEEVQLLGHEFETTTERNVELKQHKLYKPTHQNLETAGYEFHLGFEITGDDNWNGQIIIGAGGSDINEGETVEGD